MKITADNSVISVSDVSAEGNWLCITANDEADIQKIMRLIERVSALAYSEDNGEDCRCVTGAYSVDSVGMTAEKPVLRFRLSVTVESRISALETENAALRSELLDTQEALAEIVEGGVSE